jgi:hypothetical protein
LIKGLESEWEDKKMKRIKNFLMVNGIIDPLLGLLLGLFPRWFVDLLDLPGYKTDFWIRVLGAVLFGVGAASLIEKYRGSGGLGLPGAILINLSGASMLAAWLIFNPGYSQTLGKFILWGFVLVLVVLSALEWMASRSS